MADNDFKVASFSEVFQDELRRVRERRTGLRLADGEGKLFWDANEDGHLQAVQNLIVLREMQARALDANLCGLACSGGGIRSATFSLGVLQGLAVVGLLRRFDYLSTVSGGGYIGSWLSAWIYRSGLNAVERDLQSPRFHPDETHGVEPEPIRHLRLYSNYLAPRPGLFTLDGWVLIAIFLRNLLLNQLVLGLSAVSLLLAVLAGVEVFAACLKPSDPRVLGVCVSVSLLFLATAIGSTSLIAPGQPTREKSPKYILSLSMHCFMLSSICACLALMTLVTGNVQRPLGGEWWCLPAAFATVLSVACMTLGLTGMSGSRPASLAAGAVAGGLGGLLLGAALRMLLGQLIEARTVVAGIAVFGVPLVLLCLVAVLFLQVGLKGTSLTELEREWWSAHNARLMMFALLWSTMFGIAVYGPFCVAQLAGQNYGRIMTGLLGTGWVGIVLGGLRAAYSTTTRDGRSRGVAELLARIAPPVFLVGIFLLLAFATQWLEYDVNAFVFKQDERLQYSRRLPELLRDFDVVDAIPLPGITSPIPACLALFVASGLMAGLAWLMGRRVGVNTFSLHNLYANRLARCYLGASNGNRSPDVVTNLDPQDDLRLTDFDADLGGRKDAPLHIINGALNRKAGDAVANQRRGDRATASRPADVREGTAESLAFLERQAESWVFTPLYCGCETTGYWPTNSFAGRVRVSTAMAVSGAAVSPNMGFHSSPLVTMLLTVFNVRLGAWFENPVQKQLTSRKQARRKAAGSSVSPKVIGTPAVSKPVPVEDDNPPASPMLLYDELLGRTKADSKYVYISDGGHFENLGVYELIRRRCRFIVVVDAGADPQIHENVGHLVRKVRIDFGIRIDVDMQPVTPDAAGKAAAHLVIGRIHYGDVHPAPTSPPGKLPVVPQSPADPAFAYDNNQGIIVWLKNAVCGDEPGDLVNFRAMNPAFPFDTTLDQFYGESQFESYRVLGLLTVRKMLENVHFPSSAKSRQLRRDAHQVQNQFPGTRFQEGEAPVPEREFAGVTCNFSPSGGKLHHYPTVELFRTLYNAWVAKPPQFVAGYVEQNQSYIAILEKLRSTSNLKWIAKELYGSASERATARAHVGTPDEQLPERMMAAEMLALLENVWFALDLERFQLDPVHEGWMHVFEKWLTAQHVIGYWDNRPDPGAVTGLRHEFSPVFQRFVDRIVQASAARN